ncbi:MAG: APC family permease [Polyangiaceae bacterium]
MAKPSSEQLVDAKIPGLRRSLGLFAVISLGLNGVIGQGIFLVPGKAAARMGPSALVALGLGGLLCFCLALCFAEVGSQFKGTGGAYLYARETFGEFVGFEVGWMTCCVAVIAWATLSNGFTLVLSEFLPAVASGWPQKLTIATLVTGLCAINLRGAKSGAAVVKFFTVAKLVPIVIFVLMGAFFMESGNFQPFAPHGMEPLAETTMILLYAFVGFETMVVPAGEMNDPQRSVPLALFAVLTICTVIYIGVFAVAIGTLPGLAGNKNPIAEASANFMGPAGGTLIAAGIVLSVFGTNSGAALVSPRRFFAPGERGDLPALFARVNPDTGAPVPAIAITWLGTLAIALSGSFEQLLVLGVVARFAQYIPTTIAVLVLRRRRPAHLTEAGYRIPFGPVIPAVTLGLCAWLLWHTDPKKLAYGGCALLLGIPLYFIARARRPKAESRSTNKA